MRSLRQPSILLMATLVWSANIHAQNSLRVNPQIKLPRAVGGAVQVPSLKQMRLYLRIGNVSKNRVRKTPDNPPVIATIQPQTHMTRTDRQLDSLNLRLPRVPLHPRDGAAILLQAKPRHSSPIAIDADRKRVYVVNSQSGSVTAIDSAANRKISEVAIGSDPRSLAVQLHTKRLFITNMRDDTIAVLSLKTLAPVATIKVSDEPYGVVSSPVAALIFVACAGGNEIAVINAETLQVVHLIAVSENPRGLAVTADGKRLYVTHFLSGRVSVIDLVQRKRLAELSIGRYSNMVQSLVIHPHTKRVYLPHIRSNITTRHMLFDTTVFPVVSVIDSTTNRHLRKETIGLDAVDRPVNMPFAATISQDGKTLYVVNSGSNDLSVINLKTGFGIGHLDVGSNPRGIAISPGGKTAYVANHVSKDVTVIDLDALKVTQTIQVTSDRRAQAIQRGEELFFSSARPELSRDRWVSCASCHFDGHIDGRTWPTPRGPRNTQSLRAISDTHPLHWSADRASVQEFQKTFQNVMGGTGLTKNELDDLAAFVNSIQLPPNPHRLTNGSTSDEAVRGRIVFESAKTRCATCHTGPAFTDRKRYDVGTGTSARERLGPRFDTPSLRGLYASAPYLHDGRAITLRALLTTANLKDRHGMTSHLGKKQLDDLIRFLLEIPAK